MDNLRIYQKVQAVPENAKKKIGGGRLKGMTDINPMWRIKELTATFGPCGIGWKYTIDKQWIELSPATNEIAGFCNITLYVKENGEWSDGIPGTGGSSFVVKEKNGSYMSDEVYKMALTDALSVACKALGFGADVYWQAGRSKYTQETPTDTEEIPACSDCGSVIQSIKKKDGTPWSEADIASYSQRRFGRVLCPDCQRKAVSNKS